MGGKPGDEVAITDASYHTWAHSCLIDGRVFVSALHPVLGWGVFLMSPKSDGKPVLERVQCGLASQGQFHRASISLSEKKICFEFQAGAGYVEVGHSLYIADFDAEQRTITNLQVIANEERKRNWYAN